MCLKTRKNIFPVFRKQKNTDQVQILTGKRRKKNFNNIFTSLQDFRYLYDAQQRLILKSVACNRKATLGFGSSSHRTHDPPEISDCWIF